jgi:Ca-activated chloride channel homolog
MTFADPLILLALLAIPLLIWWYWGQQRRRGQAASAFVLPALTASVAPARPGWRRHAPMIAFALALAVLIIAAARPQRTIAKPVTDGAVMLVDDVSASMQATDVAPTREQAAQRAARHFLATVPGSVQVGLLAFARTPTVLQSPTSDHVLTQAAVGRLPKFSGGTAVGDAILTATHELKTIPKVGGKLPPGAIVLISDGASNYGSDVIAAAREAASLHIPIYTVALGTYRGTIPITKGGTTVTVLVPPSPQELAQIATVSGGKAFTASDTAGLRAVYAHLEAKLGHKTVKQQITASFAGVGLALLLVGSVLTLRWFGRLI